MKLQKMVLTFLLFCLVFSLGAAGRKEYEGLTFAATYMTLNNSFFVALDDSIREYCEDAGGRLLSYNPDMDQVRQINQIQDMISLNVDAIFLNPVDWKGIRPALEEAKRAGIPVIVVDAPVYDDSLVVSTINSDNYRAGVLLAQDLIGRRKEARIVILDHPTNKPSIDRLNGFLNTLKSRKEMKVVAKQSAFGTLERAVPLMEDMLESIDDISVAMGTNDPTALGIISALEAARQSRNILVYGIDGSPEGLGMVRSGKMMGTVAQSPRIMGQTSVETALAYLRGESVAAKIVIPVELINSGNIRRYPEDVWH